MHRLSDIVNSGFPIVNIGRLMSMRTDRERSAFGARMHAARKRASVTQKQVQEALGISQSNLSDIEGLAERSGFTAQLAALYRCDAHYLATGEGLDKYTSQGAVEAFQTSDAATAQAQGGWYLSDEEQEFLKALRSVDDARIRATARGFLQGAKAAALRVALRDAPVTGGPGKANVLDLASKTGRNRSGSRRYKMPVHDLQTKKVK